MRAYKRPRQHEELEAVRVELLGRKGGVLTQLSKDMGKLSPEERVARGKFINAAKLALEEAYEARKAEFENAALATGSIRNGWTRPSPRLVRVRERCIP